MSGASVLPAIIISRQKRIIEAFRSAGAVDAATARKPEELGIRHWPHLSHLLRRGVIREATVSGSYYVDLLAAETWQSRRRQVLLAMLMVGFLGILLMIIFRQM